MCDSDQSKAGTGWRGWMPLPEARPCKPVGDWIDLTWPLSPTVPRIASFPPPRLERIASIPQRPLNITELQMVVHTGTHVDSPRHFYNDGPAFQDIPLARLMGQGVVWRIDVPLYGLIEPADLERMRPALEPGDILALDTGVAERVGTPDYDRHASLSVAAAEWLVQRRLKLLAVDMPTPDIAIDKRAGRLHLAGAPRLARRRRADRGAGRQLAFTRGQARRVHVLSAQHRRLRRGPGAGAGARHRELSVRLRGGYRRGR